ncbi:MAG TPA: BMP family ABC transporter substrate-binding protein [Chloroflexi bacterium]|nr:BMP family ABC transporter substrate-binding protein [Chloroflexota bacterium]HHW88762.1 BMP family ABC transporter substrate-binding protein [Chloroflexota bacterium]
MSLLAIIALVVVACAAPAAAPQAPAASSDAGAAASAQPLRILHFVNGVLGDKSFFDSAQRGVQRAADELGAEVKTIEAGVDPTGWEAALVDAAANEEFDILIVGTFQMIEYLEKIAPQYPDKKFFLYDAPVNYEGEACAPNKCANVYSILYKQNEGSYLAGVYAAAMTTQAMEGMNPDPIIGSIGGQEIPVILDFMVGYEQGAKDTNPDIQVIRQFAGGWNDPAKGKELAKAQYSQGADIVFQIAGGTGQGVFEAAAEDGKYAIGVDSDQALIIESANPDQAARILTSMMKNVDNSIFRGVQKHLDGTLPYGTAEALGIAEGGVGLARNKFYDASTPDEVKALVDAAEQKIIAGEIVVETAFQ